MRKPRIAIIADVILRDEGPVSLFHGEYATKAVCDSITKAGGLAAILPICDRKDLQENIKEYLEIFDGFYFCGGIDVDPQFYDEDPKWGSGVFYTEKDYFAIHLFKAVYASGKAIFGNCRGIQLINVALGGNLYQDIQLENPDFFIKHENYSTISPAHEPSHFVDIDETSHLYPIIGGKVFVNSRHHQAIKTVADDLKVIGRSADGSVEAVQTIKDNQIVAVQWHPENLWPENQDMLKIYEDFIERTKDRMTN